MKNKVAGIGNIGDEELTRLRLGRQSLGDVEGTLEVLMGSESIKNMKDADRKKVKDLFVMHGSNITQAPNLTKEAKAKNVAALFEKISSPQLTDAQRRYPELLKVSSTATTLTPDLKPKTKGPVGTQGIVPHRSMMAGGSA